MRVFLIMMIFFSGAYTAFSQGNNKNDTIYTTSKDKTYVIFPDLVDWVDPGIKNYIYKKSGKTVFFASDKAGLEPAMLVVKYGDKLWHGTIAYKESLTEEEQFLNLNKIDPSNMPDFVNEDRVKDDESSSLSDKLIRRRMGILEGNPNEEEKTYAILVDRVIFKVSIMRQDEEHYYFKLALFNRSKLDYVVDLVDFEYKDIDPSTELETTKYEYPQIKYASSVAENGDFIAERKKHVHMFYVIKKYKISSKGALSLKVHEKEGTRTMEFEIPQGALFKMEKFD